MVKIYARAKTIAEDQNQPLWSSPMHGQIWRKRAVVDVWGESKVDGNERRNIYFAFSQPAAAAAGSSWYERREPQVTRFITCFILQAAFQFLMIILISNLNA